MTDQIEAWLKENRQWPRAMNEQHARYMLKVASEADDKNAIIFWQEIRKRIKQ